MKIFYAFVIIIQILRTCVAELNLKSVNVIFRHGDRTPTDEVGLPKDPYFNYDFYPYGKGALTNSGKFRAYKLGEFLRRRYKNFLGDIYLPELVYAQSSDYDRTKMSLQLVLAALFPPKYLQKWHPTLNWQPIPITYIPRKEDDLLLSILRPEFEDHKRRVETDEDIQERLNNLHEFMQQLSHFTGVNISSTFQMKIIYDSLVAESFMNLPLPYWAKGAFNERKLLEGALLHTDITSYDNNITSFLVGKLMSKITSGLIATANQPTQNMRPKIYLYSGHDFNVIGILRTLNVFNTHIPEYGSAVIIELFEEYGSHYIKVLYYQGVEQYFNELWMPRCDIICPIEKYLENINGVLTLVNNK